MTKDSPSKKTDTRLIQSIQRAAKILEIFIDEKNPVGITDFAQKLDLPKTTIQGIVTTLVELRFLEKDQNTSKYRLGTKLFQLGMTYATNLDIISLARVWMERASFQFREPVNLGILVGKKVLILFRVEPEKGFMTFPQIGSVIPAHTTSIGKTLFAYMRDEKREEILKDYSFDKLTENSITNIDDFRRELKSIRETGIAFDNEENFIGLMGIGGPVYNYTGHVIAAFTITGDAEHLKKIRDDVINEVRFTSREVSRQLGYKGNKNPGS
ncbi:MAG TPA: IclR family transcriptional regulator [Spirochaetota bacterium]|nr:IclR family transcriptional regulator [Spirochaetota bacterium]HRZ28200.1 IclR family transcriptional regulator [Spirochaetota bacterium]HSA15660.1 IclR family transcriptional regulator [Spirochaetota bacterium]